MYCCLLQYAGLSNTEENLLAATRLKSFYFHMLVFCLDQFSIFQNILRHNILYSLECTQTFMEIFTCEYTFFVTCISFTDIRWSVSLGFFLSLYSVIFHEIKVRFIEQYLNNIGWDHSSHELIWYAFLSDCKGHYFT